MLPTYNRNLAFGKNSAYLRQFWRADERTRTAYPCSLRVRNKGLQAIAVACYGLQSSYLSGISFTGLHTIAEHCALGDVEVM